MGGVEREGKGSKFKFGLVVLDEVESFKVIF